jgi:mannose-6-phosphate isomerase-like protein (cupin superfamily)
MKIVRKDIVPRYKRDNISSALLVSSLTTDAKNLTITIVEMEPEGIQWIHSHEQEQMYYILEGKGEMTVGKETREVQKDDCIFFRSNSPHGLKNTGNTILRYLSAASPSFTVQECQDLWPLPSIKAERETQ